MLTNQHYVCSTNEYRARPNERQAAQNLNKNGRPQSTMPALHQRSGRETSNFRVAEVKAALHFCHSKG